MGNSIDKGSHDPTNWINAERAVPRITSVVHESADLTPRRNAVLVPTQEQLKQNPELLKERNIHPDYKRDARLPVLVERENTHGDFKKVASVAQELKQVLKHTNGNFTYVEQESLDLICTKLARIVCGKAHEPDHWKDIIGYATLVLESL